VLPVLLFVVAVGCGGGPTKTATQVDTQPDVGRLSKAGYIQLGDVICKNHQSRREDLESQTIDLGRLNSEAKAHRVAELLRQESENLTAEARELESLQPPPGDAGRVGSVPALVRAKARLIDDWAKAYDDLDTPQIRSLQIRIGEATAKARDRARAYGFEICGGD
jgi:DNA repair ATPase RecN